MNAWLVNHYALPPSESGITRHHDLAVRLNDRGLDTSIVASSYDHYSRVDRLPEDSPDFATSVVDGVRYGWVRTPPYGSTTIGRARNMVAFFTRISRRPNLLDLPRPDVVVGSSPHLLAPLGARSIARRYGAAFVIEVRDLWPDSLVELGGPPRSHPAIVALSQIERSLYRSADHIVTVLPGAPEHIRERAGRDVDVSYIPNGTTVPSSPPPPELAGGPLQIVYAGTLGHANALDVVLAAAAILEDSLGVDAPIWRLVGPGPDLERLQSLAAHLGLRTVRFEPPVPKSEIPQLLSSADACLLHLRDSPVFRWGISPNKLFDYFAAAKPVLFGVRTPDDPVSRSHSGITFKPECATDLARAASKMVATTSIERQRMGASGFEYLKRNHDLDRIAEQYALVLRTARSKHHSHQSRKASDSTRAR